MISARRQRMTVLLLLLLGVVRLVAGCADAQKSAYYPSEFRAGVSQSYDEEARHAHDTTLGIEFRWPLKPAPVRDVSRPLPSPTPAPSPKYAEPPCSLPLPN